jgi:hypothetical protein
MSWVSGRCERRTHTNQLLVKACLGILVKSEPTNACQSALKVFPFPVLLLQCAVRVEIERTSGWEKPFALGIQGTVLCLLPLQLVQPVQLNELVIGGLVEKLVLLVLGGRELGGARPVRVLVETVLLDQTVLQALQAWLQRGHQTWVFPVTHEQRRGEYIVVILTISDIMFSFL